MRFFLGVPIYFTLGWDRKTMAVTASHVLDLKALKNPDGMGQKQVARVPMSKSAKVSPVNRRAVNKVNITIYMQDNANKEHTTAQLQIHYSFKHQKNPPEKNYWTAKNQPNLSFTTRPTTEEVPSSPSPTVHRSGWIRARCCMIGTTCNGRDFTTIKSTHNGRQVAVTGIAMT